MAFSGPIFTKPTKPGDHSEHTSFNKLQQNSVINLESVREIN